MAMPKFRGSAKAGCSEGLMVEVGLLVKGSILKDFADLGEITKKPWFKMALSYCVVVLTWWLRERKREGTLVRQT